MNNVAENCYSYKNNQVTNFYKYGAEELGLGYMRNQKVHEFYYKGKKIGEAKGLRAFSNSKTAFIICRDEFKTEKLLHNLNVPTLNSKLFYENQKKDIHWKAYLSLMKYYSLVILLRVQKVWILPIL